MPECLGECINDSECPLDRACFDFNCRSPCDSACGQNAECQARNHGAICSCPSGFVGKAACAMCIYIIHIIIGERKDDIFDTACASFYNNLSHFYFIEFKIQKNSKNLLLRWNNFFLEQVKRILKSHTFFRDSKTYYVK